MSTFYVSGEKKSRSGVYRKYVNRLSVANTGLDDGKVAVVLKSDWGPVGKAQTVTSLQEAINVYGNSAAVKNTLHKLFKYGVASAVVSRVGTGGTQASVTLKDTATSAANVVTLKTKYPTSRSFKVTIRQKLGNTTSKVVEILEGNTILESYEFAAGTNEPSNLANVINTSSTVLVATDVVAGNGTLAAVTQTALSGGQDPTGSTTQDYSTALNKLEAIRFDVLITDSNDVAVHAVVSSFMSRIKDDGALNMAVIGEPTTVSFDTRCTNAAAFNSETIVYCGGSYVDESGSTIDGYSAAAVVAALIATTPSNKSIVHSVITDAAETYEKITNTQHETAIANGCVMFSESADGVVWVESAINTLINPPANMDDGWKKIKRTKVRQELIKRINNALEPIIGKVNCDSSGVANVVSLGRQIISAMKSEKKLIDGDFYEDPENPQEGDSAWFIVEADDQDALEKIYLTYQFRFSTNS